MNPGQDETIINSFGAGETVTNEKKLAGIQGLYVYHLLEKYINEMSLNEVYFAHSAIAEKEDELKANPSDTEQARLNAYENDPYVLTMTEMALRELFFEANAHDFPTRLRYYEMALLRNTFSAKYPNTKFTENNVLISGGGLCVPEIWAQFVYRLKPESRKTFLTYLEQTPPRNITDPSVLFDLAKPATIMATDPLLFDYKSTGDMLETIRAFYPGIVHTIPGTLVDTREPGIYLSQDTHASNAVRLLSKKRAPVVDALTIFRLEPGTISDVSGKVGVRKASEFVTNLIGLGRNLKPGSVMNITFGYGNTNGELIHRLTLADFTERVLREAGIEIVSINLIDEMLMCVETNATSRNMFVNLMMENPNLRSALFAWLSLHSLRFRTPTDKDTQKIDEIYDKKGQALFYQTALNIQTKIGKLAQI